MVTTYLAPRLLRHTGTTLVRASSVTMRDITAVRRYWLVIVSGFFEPVLYLLSIGFGVGALVGQFTLADGRVVSYASFVAPAMLAASAMNGALTETTNNFFGKLKWQKLYDGMVATPLRPIEIALGELAWALLRGAFYSSAFLALMIGMGLTTVWHAIPALLATLLIGFAFGGIGMALATFMRGWQDFDYVTVVVFAMFIFSGTFAPADGYPAALHVLIGLTPLYHGVELVRGFTTGVLDWAMLGHAAFLAALAAVGLTIAARRMTRMLCP